MKGVDEINSTVTEGSRDTIVQFTIGTPIDRAVNDVRSRSARSAATCPTASSSRRSARADTAEPDDIANFAVESTDMTLEQLSWYVDNTVVKRAALGRRHGRRSTAAAASTARSA